MNKLIYSVILAIPLLLSGGFGQAQGQTNNVNVFVLVTPTTYQLDLKAIEGEIPTRNFVIKPQSVVQVKQGDNLGVATQPITQIVESVKVQDQRGVIKELESLGNNVYSLAGIPIGNYILDVVVDLGSNKKGAYETILVILAKGQQPVNPTQIINQVKQITDVQIIFDDDNNCSNKPGSAGLKFPQDKRTECEKRDYDECEKKGMKTSGGFCDNIYELFNDNDCFGFKNQKECDDWYNRPICRDQNPSANKCLTPLPYCGTPETVGAELCRDEIDDCTDESGCTPEDPVICQQYIGNPCIDDTPTPPPKPEEGENIPDVPEEDTATGNEDNDSVDNGDSGNDNGSVDNGDSGDSGNSDNTDSGSGEPFD